MQGGNLRDIFKFVTDAKCTVVMVSNGVANMIQITTDLLKEALLMTDEVAKTTNVISLAGNKSG